jgi:hypothetical protein
MKQLTNISGLPSAPLHSRSVRRLIHLIEL